ncbi:hypothetical protein Glove_502g47 [Diversispora epigaea]|uniref:Uncharacterized protein n=1 Tax=Diversispora epigaea TaxID=1348612 RepID=A0A397GJB1_9GLOM|nr:hypothetical protein Glove_502g47 [Diversispora epigaea]
MSWKCDFCPQCIFITKTSYTNHIKQCLESINSSEELSLEIMMINSLESENLLNNENNFESIHKNSNENENENNDSNNAETEEESLTSNISHSSVLFFENMELSNSNAENYSFNNYTSNNNNICEEAEPIEFPNNAYADLMAFVINYNLSNETTNAVIHFFNEHSNLPLSPLPKNVKKRHKLMEKIKIPTLTSKKHKILTHNNIDYYLFYYPVFNCIKNILSIFDISQNFTLRFENFKKNTKASLPNGSKLLSIIFYSNATTTDILDKSSLHSIYISIGNISTKKCNKFDVKQLLGYLLILKTKDKFEKKSKDFKKLVCLTFHNSMKFLLDPLFAKKGIDLEVDNKIYWFFPRISTIICDWPEAATFGLIYKSTNSNFSCHFCLISKILLSNTDLSDITFRNNENMQEYFYNDAGQDVTTVPDRMHHLDLELFHYQIKFTQALLQKQDSSLVKYRILMKVMVFVVNNLYEENKNNVEDFIENKKLSEVYAKWNKMYMISRSESDLENFQFGTINRYTTETYESLHKNFVKISYRMSNKKNVEDQIMKTKKPTKLLNFSSKLFETKLTEAYIYFCEKINDPNINDNMIKGFDQFLECFDDFLENILEIKDIKECDIIIYGTFNNVAILMDSNESSDYQSDEGLCYGKILLMAKIEIKEKSLLNLALVQWYNFKFQKNSYLYNCPLLKLVELYNLIPIETIDNIVHIIPRFDKDNEYFVNKYIS